MCCENEISESKLELEIIFLSEIFYDVVGKKNYFGNDVESVRYFSSDFVEMVLFHVCSACSTWKTRHTESQYKKLYTEMTR